MRQISRMLVLLGLWPSLAMAQTNFNLQSITPLAPFTALLNASDAGTCSTTTAGCLVLGMGGYTGVSIQVSANASGNTLSFETTNDRVPSASSTWVGLSLISVSNMTSAASSTTSTGMWSGGVVGSTVRVRLSTATSGSATVTIRGTASSAAGGGGGGGLIACGSTTQVLYNLSGACAGSANLTFDGTGLSTKGLTLTTDQVSEGSDIIANNTGGAGHAGVVRWGLGTSTASLNFLVVDTVDYSGGAGEWYGKEQAAFFAGDTLNGTVLGDDSGPVHIIAGGTTVADEYLRVLTTGVTCVGPFSNYTGCDVGVARTASGVLEVDTGTAGTFAGLNLASARFGTNPATTGQIRLPAGVSSITARTAANNHDIKLVSVDSGNNVTFGDDAFDASTRLESVGHIYLVPGATLRWDLFGTSMLPYTDGVNTIGGTANGLLGTYLKPVAIASLPSAAAGAIAAVNDALIPVIGSPVAGGGAAYAFVTYNGSAWTVSGK